MLTKKECLNSYALLTLCVGNITETKIFKQLIEEHFELVEKYKRFKELSNLSDGVIKMKKEDYISLINYGVQSPTCKKGLLELVDKYFELEKASKNRKYDKIYKEQG